MTAPVVSTTVPERVWVVDPCAKANEPPALKTAINKITAPNRNALRFIDYSILSIPPSSGKERHSMGYTAGIHGKTWDRRPCLPSIEHLPGSIHGRTSREWETLYAVPISGQARCFGGVEFGLLDEGGGSMPMADDRKNKKGGPPKRPARRLPDDPMIDHPITRSPDYQLNRVTSWMMRLEFSCTPVMR